MDQSSDEYRFQDEDEIDYEEEEGNEYSEAAEDEQPFNGAPDAVTDAATDEGDRPHEAAEDEQHMDGLPDEVNDEVERALSESAEDEEMEPDDLFGDGDEHDWEAETAEPEGEGRNDENVDVDLMDIDYSEKSMEDHESPSHEPDDIQRLHEDEYYEDLKETLPFADAPVVENQVCGAEIPQRVLENRPVPPRPVDPSTKVCKWWLKGNCSRGENCWFRHEHIEGKAGDRGESSKTPRGQSRLLDSEGIDTGLANSEGQNLLEHVSPKTLTFKATGTTPESNLAYDPKVDILLRRTSFNVILMQNKDLQTRLKEIESQLSEIDNLKAHNEALQTRVNELQDLSQLSGEDDLKAHNEALQTRVNELQAQLSKTDDILEGIATENESLQFEVDDLKEKLAAKGSKGQDRELQARIKELQSLLARSEDVHAEKAELERELRHLGDVADENEELKLEIEVLRGKLGDSPRQSHIDTMHTGDHELAGLAAMVESMDAKEEQDSLVRENQLLKIRIEELEVLVAELQPSATDDAADDTGEEGLEGEARTPPGYPDNSLELQGLRNEIKQLRQQLADQAGEIPVPIVSRDVAEACSSAPQSELIPSLQNELAELRELKDARDYELTQLREKYQKLKKHWNQRAEEDKKAALAIQIPPQDVPIEQLAHARRNGEPEPALAVQLSTTIQRFRHLESNYRVLQGGNQYLEGQVERLKAQNSQLEMELKEFKQKPSTAEGETTGNLYAENMRLKNLVEGLRLDLQDAENRQRYGVETYGEMLEKIERLTKSIELNEGLTVVLTKLHNNMLREKIERAVTPGLGGETIESVEDAEAERRLSILDEKLERKKKKYEARIEGLLLEIKELKARNNDPKNLPGLTLQLEKEKAELGDLVDTRNEEIEYLRKVAAKARQEVEEANNSLVQLQEERRKSAETITELRSRLLAQIDAISSNNVTDDDMAHAIYSKLETIKQSLDGTEEQNKILQSENASLTAYVNVQYDLNSQLDSLNRARHALEHQAAKVQSALLLTNDVDTISKLRAENERLRLRITESQRMEGLSLDSNKGLFPEAVSKSEEANIKLSIQVAALTAELQRIRNAGGDWEYRTALENQNAELYKSVQLFADKLQFATKRQTYVPSVAQSADGVYTLLRADFEVLQTENAELLRENAGLKAQVDLLHASITEAKADALQAADKANNAVAERLAAERELRKLKATVDERLASVDDLIREKDHTRVQLEYSQQQREDLKTKLAKTKKKLAYYRAEAEADPGFWQPAEAPDGQLVTPDQPITTSTPSAPRKLKRKRSDTSYRGGESSGDSDFDEPLEPESPEEPPAKLRKTSAPRPKKIAIPKNPRPRKKPSTKKATVVTSAPETSNSDTAPASVTTSGVPAPVPGDGLTATEIIPTTPGEEVITTEVLAPPRADLVAVDDELSPLTPPPSSPVQLRSGRKVRLPKRFGYS